MRTWARAAWIALAPLAAASLVVACGTDAVGVQACRSIETARCESAPACGIDLAIPVHTGNDVTACVRFYNDQCLHGLVTQQQPSTIAVNQCVSQILAAGAAAAKGNKSTCGVVSEPQNTAACLFLVPGPDASVPPDASEDAGEDASDDAG